MPATAAMVRMVKDVKLSQAPMKAIMIGVLGRVLRRPWWKSCSSATPPLKSGFSAVHPQLQTKFFCRFRKMQLGLILARRSKNDLSGWGMTTQSSHPRSHVPAARESLMWRRKGMKQGRERTLTCFVFQFVRSPRAQMHTNSLPPRE